MSMVLRSKPPSGSMVGSVFYTFNVDNMGMRNSWGLGRPGQIARPIAIGRAQARKTSETRPILPCKKQTGL